MSPCYSHYIFIYPIGSSQFLCSTPTPLYVHSTKTSALRSPAPPALETHPQCRNGIPDTNPPASVLPSISVVVLCAADRPSPAAAGGQSRLKGGAVQWMHRMPSLLWRGCHTSGLQGAPCTECIGHTLPLLCGSLGQPRRRPAFFQRKGHAWKSDGVRGSRCFKEVALQSTERSFTNDIQNRSLDTTRYPPWGTSIGNPHIWTEHQGGGTILQNHY